MRLNVPPGQYTFRAIAVANPADASTAQLAFPIVIRQPLWKQAWFLPAVIAAAVIAVVWSYFHKEIAHELGIRIDTVAFHLGNIYRKLHVRTRSEAILKFMNRRGEARGAAWRRIASATPAIFSYLSTRLSALDGGGRGWGFEGHDLDEVAAGVGGVAG